MADKTLRDVANPFQNMGKGFENRHLYSKTLYGSKWKEGFYTLYGKKAVELRQGFFRNLFTDPFIKSAQLLHLRTVKQIREKQHSSKGTIGLLDFANPLIMLTLLNIQLTNALKVKSLTLRHDKRIGLARLLFILAMLHMFLIRLPIGALAYATTLVWDIVKATIAVVAVTLSSVVWAPVVYHQKKNAVKEEHKEPLLEKPSI